MKVNREQRRALGGLALLVGIGLAIGSFAYGQLRFPMTNYRSTITIENPVVYYEHELRAGDTLFFHIEVTGAQAQMEVRKGPANGAGEVVLTAQVDHWTVVPFAVSATGMYSVLFRTVCEGCTTFIQAQVDQALGSMGVLPLPVSMAIGVMLAAGGGWLVTFPGRRCDVT